MNIRNIAIIAHVDHGKTTLVDFLLKQSHTFRDNQDEMQQTTILDSNPLERERGITILAKNTAVMYHDVKINIIDTPGHADFSGEVERTLNMADGALLIVDAQEGPMPQTKFVLKKALQLGLKIVVIINKVDKQLADIPHTLERINDLFLELATDTDHLDFPVIYAIGREGKAALKPEDVPAATDLDPIFQVIINEIPEPKIAEGPFQMLVTSLDYDTHKGKHVIGRITRGTVKKGQNIVLLNEAGEKVSAKIDTISVTKGLEKTAVEEVTAGEIVDITGIPDAKIGDTITDASDPSPLPRISIEEPTIKISLGANTSPFAGKEGKFSNSRQVLERLNKELETNVSLRVENQGDKFMLSGRGELHLSVLIETLRREGYEFQVGKPEVIIKEIDGQKMEPMEDVMLDVPDEYQGAVTQELGQRRGEMTHMEADGKGNTRFEYKIASKSLLGIRSILLTKTKGTAVLNTIFDTYAPLTPPVEQIRNGVLIASESGTATTYGLNNAQERGITFIEPATKVYEGMIIGLNSRREDMELNIVKEKKQTNMRASSADIAVVPTPPLKMSLEQYLDFLEEDELLEVTPLNLRPRKKLLSKTDRIRNKR
ncbi:MAG TPA: translational GTPase TypA [Candidatus Saccharimonadales bacterium]|nr:translational GTPase TypA [Candidatus Saccharimonadales bacterium]